VLVADGVVALKMLGYILTKDPERLDEAEQVLRRAREIEPGSSSPQASLGVCLSAYGSAGDMAEALQLCQQAVAGAALEGAEARANALAAHGIVLVRSGDAVAARAKLVGAQGLAVDNLYFTDLSLLLEQS
jgi:Flp pilus assembly protein TadD